MTERRVATAVHSFLRWVQAPVSKPNHVQLHCGFLAWRCDQVPELGAFSSNDNNTPINSRRRAVDTSGQCHQARSSVQLARHGLRMGQPMRHTYIPNIPPST